MPAGSLRLLVEAVQHINGFDKLGDVHHAKSALLFGDANFARARADDIKRLPVVRIEPRLHLGELKASLAARFIREREQIVVAGADPANLFFQLHEFLSCTKFYTQILRRSIQANTGTRFEGTEREGGIRFGRMAKKKARHEPGAMCRTGRRGVSVAAAACNTPLLDGIRETFQHADAVVPADTRIRDALAVSQLAAFLQVLTARDEMRFDHHADDALVA